MVILLHNLNIQYKFKELTLHIQIKNTEYKQISLLLHRRTIMLKYIKHD